MKKHTVKRGDTLYKISKEYGVTIGDIMNANPIIGNPDLIVSGWVLNIPEPIDYEALGRNLVKVLADMDKIESLEKLVKLMEG